MAVDKNSESKEPKYLDVLKEFDPELLDSAAAMTDQELNNRISASAKDLVETTILEKGDEHLNSMKEELKEAKAPYTERKKADKARIEFMRDILIGRGKA